MDMNGAVILNKDKGISSFSAVKKVKYIFGAQKAGHTGTLDPLASGVLIVCLGKHTRLSEYLTEDEKEYSVLMYLGFSTDTYDLEGKITAEAYTDSLSEDSIHKAMKKFSGTINQIPPVYSAIKVKGRKLYDYARKGVAVEIPSRTVDIKRLEVKGISKEVHEGRKVTAVHYDVLCSKGTYIRSICNDIGETLGVHGTMAGLVRTRAGKFNIDDSFTINELEEYAAEGKLDEAMIDPIPYISLERLCLNKDDTLRYMKGIKLNVKDMSEGEYLAVLDDGRIAGICTVDAEGFLKSRKRLI